MIDLTKYIEKPFPTHEKINEHVSDYDIYKYYLDDLVIGRAMSSPFREDRNPSFSVFPSHKHDGKLLFKDHATGDSGDALIMVSRIFNVSYNEALQVVVADFRLNNFYKGNIIASPKKPKISKNVPVFESTYKHIGITPRKWMYHDKLFWSSFGISKKTLIEYNVIPIKYIFMGNNVFAADKYAYAYVEYKDNLVRYKIYQPYNLYNKWLNNFTEGTISGFTQMPQSDQLLIISSSLKDGMTLHDMGYNFIAPQTENYVFKKHIIQNLTGRFENIVIFYDNDEAGMNAAIKMHLLYGFNYILTHNADNKDISDYYKNKGHKKAIKLVERELKLFGYEK